MDYIFEIIVAVLLTYYFIKKEKPKIHFLFLGYLFFTLSLILQIPVKILEIKLADYLGSNYLPTLLLVPLTIIISELIKYFSMRRYIKTKSKKNGILFGIGWITLESINLYTILFFTTVLNILSLKFDYTILLSEQYTFINFIFIFIVNIAVTVLVIMSIIKKKYMYLIHGILFSLTVFFGMYILDDIAKYIFTIAILIISFSIIFTYRKF